MSTYVLVHGAWHGSWCWSRVRAELSHAGNEVFTPSLSGLGERSHLLSPTINLETHIADVVNLVRWEDLTEVILVGHSYGGAVITGAADRITDRISSLVYLDAFLLDDGESIHDTFSDEARSSDLRRVDRDGEGWRLSPIPAKVFNVNERDRAWVDRMCTPQPITTFTQPLKLSGRVTEISDVSYILASDWSNPTFPTYMDRAVRSGWNTSTFDCGHDIMIDEPDRLARQLLVSPKPTPRPEPAA